MERCWALVVKGKQLSVDILGCVKRGAAANSFQGVASRTRENKRIELGSWVCGSIKWRYRGVHPVGGSFVVA